MCLALEGSSPITSSVKIYGKWEVITNSYLSSISATIPIDVYSVLSREKYTCVLVTSVSFSFRDGPFKYSGIARVPASLVPYLGTLKL